MRVRNEHVSADANTVAAKPVTVLRNVSVTDEEEAALAGGGFSTCIKQ